MSKFVYLNEKGNDFVTGFDTMSAEELEKKNRRMQRFGGGVDVGNADDKSGEDSTTANPLPDDDVTMNVSADPQKGTIICSKYHHHHHHHHHHYHYHYHYHNHHFLTFDYRDERDSNGAYYECQCAEQYHSCLWN
jgi:hypothetical protein